MSRGRTARSCEKTSFALARPWLATDFERALFVLALVAAPLSLLLQSYQALSHDCAWYLVSAGQWLDGASIYGETAFDPNPPMIVWLSGAVVSVGRLLGAAPALVLRALAVLLSL